MPEHQRDIFVIFTMMMEILQDPTSNKLLVGDVGDSMWIELVTLDINLDWSKMGLLSWMFMKALFKIAIMAGWRYTMMLQTKLKLPRGCINWLSSAALSVIIYPLKQNEPLYYTSIDTPSVKRTLEQKSKYEAYDTCDSVSSGFKRRKIDAVKKEACTESLVTEKGENRAICTEEQTDGEAMINCIKHGDQPLPRVTQVSIAETSSTEQPPLKDKSMCNKIAKDLWDALARHMLGSEYGEQDRKAAVLYKHETFKATEGELLLDTYIRYLQVINELKKCGYSKDKCELNFKLLNNLQPEWKEYATMMRQNKNLMDINIDALYNILKQNQRDVNDAMGLEKKTVVVTSDPLALIAVKMKSANKKKEFVKSDDKKVKKKNDEKKRDMSKVKCYNCKKEGRFTKDCKKAKVKDYEYYKTNMLLAKKDKDGQVLLAEDHAWMESSSDSDQEINANMVFMAQIKKVLSDSEASSSSADDKISKVSYYISESESESEKKIADQEVLYDKISVQLVELDKHVRDLKNTVLEKDFKISELEECVRNKDLEIEKCLERLNVCENKLHKMGQTNQTVHMIMPSKDKMYNGRKGIGFENPNYFCKANDLGPSLYDERVINLGYTLMFLTHSDEALEIEKFKRARENKIKFAYDYGNLNAKNIIIDLEDEVVSLLEKEKENLKTIKSLKSKDVKTGVESSEKVVSETENKSENDCQAIKKVYDSEENPNVIAPGMFKLRVSQSVSLISMTKTSYASNGVERLPVYLWEYPWVDPFGSG
uniref:CCHC-type domain-containing protein n=1 Tax=Tanacetum cinerariifolium TaxID=118510 RepID=A0A6L2N3D1_TANCI|nr:hypothetical protein [Tanacetum cinerariifolium]